MRKRARASENARFHADGLCWIDHARIEPDDIAWLKEVERLTLWNVHFPTAIWTHLPRLWWLDVRGGSANDLEEFRSATQLKYFQVNQVNGLRDASAIEAMTSLVCLDLYGLRNVRALPSLANHNSLLCAEIGQMKGLTVSRGLFLAPNLRDLTFLQIVALTELDVEALCSSSSLKSFGWFTEFSNWRLAEGVSRRLSLPKTQVEFHWIGSAVKDFDRVVIPSI